MDLGLKAPPSWGGRRERAGRPRGLRPRIRHRPRETFPARYPCHVTLKVRKDVPSLRSERLVREVARSFSEACSRGAFRVVQYSLQHDHAHLVVEANGPLALGK